MAALPQSKALPAESAGLPSLARKYKQAILFALLFQSRREI